MPLPPLVCTAAIRMSDTRDSARAYPRPVHRIFDRFELNFGVAGMLVVAVLIVVGAVAGILSFGDLAGIGAVYAAGVGVICAACPKGPGSTFCDPANVRNHW